MDNRGVSPVVEKTIAIGLVALFASGLTATLFAGAVPDYRRSVGQEVADRTLAEAASEIERAVPANDGTVAVDRVHVLPGTIEGAGYSLELSDRTLRLHHPDSTIGGETRLALQPSITVQNGTWSGGEFLVSVRGAAGNRTVSVGTSEP